MQVSLSDLLSPRKLRNGVVGPPKRVLIRGHAGVGKTTLCKKIVSEYVYRKSWLHSFDWLLWIPLRRLKELESGYDIEKLFRAEYFSDLPSSEGVNLAKALYKIMKDSPKKNKVLFLLDGLDEVSQEWNSDDPMDRILHHLLKQHQVNITSRPYRVNLDDLKPLDLEFGTTGFHPVQVDTYIHKNILDPKIVKDIQSFIQDHALIQGLFRIPIQLDALCYIWDNDFVSEGKPMAMTALYKAIELKLWQKDILRLQEKPLTKHDVRAVQC